MLPIGHTTLGHDEDKLTINNAVGATVLHLLLSVVLQTASSKLWMVQVQIVVLSHHARQKEASSINALVRISFTCQWISLK